MRFTKIPLIATLMAVALSLLIVLPGYRADYGDITDGRQLQQAPSRSVSSTTSTTRNWSKLVESTFDFTAAWLYASWRHSTLHSNRFPWAARRLTPLTIPILPSSLVMTEAVHDELVILAFLAELAR